MTENKILSWLDEINWDAEGLVPAIAQDSASGKVLMLAWMNREALLKTLEKKLAVYWSRSRQSLWQKGEISGHVQHVHEILLDCDNDAVILIVEQNGGIACHTGRYSCFYKKLVNEAWVDVEPVLKSPDEIYRK